jgi:MFS family permease
MAADRQSRAEDGAGRATRAMGNAGRAASSAGSAASSAGRAAGSAGRAAGSAGRWTLRLVHRVSRASGAGRTGLSDLIELTAVSSTGDAFVAVSLAGTLFFNASLNQARGQVALYLAVTMAPFAVLAPLIGPMLDRLRQGRRYILSGTLIGRGLLCWGMAGAVAHHDAVTLLPAAFGSLVLSKAYGITRSSVTPRLLPARITLVTANARCSLAALIAAAVAAPVAVGIGVVLHDDWLLRLDSVVFVAGAALGLRLPEHVDIPDPRPGTAHGAGPGPGDPAGPGTTAGLGATGGPGRAGSNREHGLRAARTLRNVGPAVGEAMRVNAVLRAFFGFTEFYLVFLLRGHHFHGVNGKLALGAVAAALAVGAMAGTGLGSALKARAPQLIMFVALTITTAITLASAVIFGLLTAVVVAFTASLAQALVKLGQDSTVQREIGEDVRSSTFAVSETLNQLSWVAGGLIGLVLSFAASGTLGMAIAGAGLTLALAGLLVSRRRRVLRAAR